MFRPYDPLPPVPWPSAILQDPQRPVVACFGVGSATDVHWRCMHRAVPERPEAAPLALLRGPMRMICSVYAYAIIKGCFLVKKLGYSRRSCAFTAQMRPTTRRHGMRRNASERRTTVARSLAGHVKVMENMYTVNILKCTPPMGTPTAMRRRYSRWRRATEARAEGAVSGRNGHGRARGSPGATGGGGPT